MFTIITASVGYDGVLGKSSVLETALQPIYLRQRHVDLEWFNLD